MGSNLIKTIIKFLISTLEFAKLYIFIQNEKNLGLKKIYLGLWAGMLKNYCNQHPPICLIAKFRAKIRSLKFGARNALFRCFWEQFQKTVVIFAISALKFALLQSLLQKIKILKFGTKNARFPYFGAGI